MIPIVAIECQMWCVLSNCVVTDYCISMDAPKYRKWINNKVDSNRSIREEFVIGINKFGQFLVDKDVNNL